MNKPEPFFWGGVILSVLGLAGTGVSAYFVATKPKNDKDSLAKTLGLFFSILLALVGMGLLVYYKMGNVMGDSGQCPLEQLSENLQTQYPSAGDIPPVNIPAPAPVPAPVSAPPPNSAVFNINVNPQKPV